MKYETYCNTLVFNIIHNFEFFSVNLRINISHNVHTQIHTFMRDYVIFCHFLFSGIYIFRSVFLTSLRGAFDDNLTVFPVYLLFNSLNDERNCKAKNRENDYTSKLILILIAKNF